MKSGLDEEVPMLEDQAEAHSLHSRQIKSWLERHRTCIVFHIVLFCVYSISFLIVRGHNATLPSTSLTRKIHNKLQILIEA